jgi:FAD-linked sulfhydryl oxidase
MVGIVFGLILTSAALGAVTSSAPSGEAIGNSGWTILHTTTMVYPDNPTDEQQENMANFFKYFAIVYPCTICSTHFQKELAEDPPKTESRQELTQWLCRVHNRVNQRLGRPDFPCAQIYARWDSRTQALSNNRGIH